MRGDVCTAVVPGHGSIMETIRRAAGSELRWCGDRRSHRRFCDQRADQRGDPEDGDAERGVPNVIDSPGYYLLQPTINAYLTHLSRTGDVNARSGGQQLAMEPR